MDNKKLIGISVVAVIVLVVAIIATSYAAFTANLTGEKVNKLTTGYVSMNCAETTFTLNDASAATSDANGIANAGTYTCVLTSTMQGTMTVGYDVALTDITTSAALGTGNVKIQPYKTIGGNTTYLGGATANTGVYINALTTPANGPYDSTITTNRIDSATVSGNQSITYTIKAWVGSEGSGSSSSTTSATGVCSDTTYTSQSTCENAGEVWGDSQTVTQSGGTFSFKVKIGATQVL